jgi:chromosome segregation ATPase
MKHNEELVRLEQLVDTLINKYKEQKNTFQTLEKKLRDREEECTLLKLDIVELQKQRAEVSTRVASLLGRIEQWESEVQGSQPKGDTKG